MSDSGGSFLDDGHSIAPHPVKWAPFPQSRSRFPVATVAEDKLPLTVAIIAFNAGRQVGPT